MNKFAKGSLAAGAGIVLLLGGAGTLAYWNSEAKLSGGSINTGQLHLDTAEGTWTQSGETIEDVDKWTMVPGDELTYTTNLLLSAEGDNLEGEIVLDGDSIVRTGAVADAIAVTFAVDESALATPAGGTVDYSAGDPAVAGDEKITFDGPGTYTIPVTVTVSFPFGDLADNSSMGAQLDLSGATFTATQTDPNASA